MGKGAPLRWLENKLLARHLSGRGIEIGALWRKFPVPRQARVYYIDRLPDHELREHYSETSGRVIAPDVVADATQLPFAHCSLDFVIASHVLEHLPFPLAALRHWYDVLRPGGSLLLKVPDKRYTFDTRRERTTLQHLIAEDGAANLFNEREHFEDWVEHVVGHRRETREFEDVLQQLMLTGYSIHYHVWIDEDLRELVAYSCRPMGLSWETAVFWRAHFYRKECVLMLQRSVGSEEANRKQKFSRLFVK